MRGMDSRLTNLLGLSMLNLLIEFRVSQKRSLFKEADIVVSPLFLWTRDNRYLEGSLLCNTKHEG